MLSILMLLGSIKVN